MASLDLYTLIRAMHHGLSKEGGGGSPHPFPPLPGAPLGSPRPRHPGFRGRSNHRPRNPHTGFVAPCALVGSSPLPRDLWVSIKNRLHSPFSLPSQQAVKQAGNQASKQANGIVVSHFFIPHLFSI